MEYNMSQVEVLESPIKSQGDKKEYRLIKLPNGLKALLIRRAPDDSDSEAVAAATITIGVGSFDDPPKALGLAHFLEHMVHMGSEKYPDESEYNDFLNANGGKRNALTSSEYTSYFFSVSEKAFPEALERLEQMIESPILSQGSMQREREAVDSEYKMHKSNDAARLLSIVELLISDKHPASQFSIGNLKTLKDDITDEDLHAELLKLQTKYVANKMCLAIQANRSLDEMQQLVVENFSSIKRSVEFERPILSLDQIFKPEFYNKMYFMKPKVPKKAIMLMWALPPALKNYKTSPLEYIAHIFGNNGEGGIFSYLRDQHLVSNIDIYLEPNSEVSNQDFTLVRIVSDLTDHGIENLGKILEAIFSYLLMIKETPNDEHRRLYEELKEKSEVDFNFHKETSSTTNVMRYATDMLFYEEADILRGRRVYQKFDEDVIRESIDALNEMKFNIILITDKHEKYDKTEKYFGTEYDEQDFPEAYKKLWNERKLIPEFYLQKPNPFRTTNFEIFVNDAESAKHPSKVYSDEMTRVWHKLDKKFKTPHVSLEVQLASPIVRRSKENYFMLKFFEHIVDFYLPKKLAQANNAGYKVVVTTNLNGLGLTFVGFNDKMPLLVDMVTGFLPMCINEADEVTFKTIKKDLKQTLEEKFMTTYNLAAELSQQILLEKYWNLHEFCLVLDNISLEDMQKFSPKFFKKMKMDVLVQGNITRDQTMNIVEIIQNNINFDPLPDDFERKSRGYELPIGTHVLRLKSLLKNDDNTFSKFFYQIGPNNLRTGSLSRLLEAILNPKAYDYLRSKEQLGYSVACGLEKRAGILGLVVYVLSQEHKHNYSTVLAKMETFMNEVAKKTIDELTDEDFENYKDSRIKILLSEDLSLRAEVVQNWPEIKEQNYVFDRSELAAKKTKILTKSDLQEFFKSFTSPENTKRLICQVIGNQLIESNEVPVDDIRNLNIQLITDKLSDSENVITSIEKFQSKLMLHPVVKFEI